MDKSYIDRHLVVDRYVLGDLAANELEDFEERLVWDEELADEVDLAGKLQEGLRHAEENSSSERRPGVLRSFQVPLAAAASFAAGLVAYSMFFTVPVIQTADNDFTTRVVALEVVRGVARQQVAVDPQSFVVFMVSVEPGYASYRAEVRKSGEPEAIWVQDGLMPGYTQSLAIGIPGSRLQAGQYVASVLATTGEAPASVREIPFEVVAAREEQVE